MGDPRKVYLKNKKHPRGVKMSFCLFLKKLPDHVSFPLHLVPVPGWLFSIFLNVYVIHLMRLVLDFEAVGYFWCIVRFLT